MPPRATPLRALHVVESRPAQVSHLTERLRESERNYALAKAAVRLRSGGQCEICGDRATQHQHRVRRGMGGSSRNASIHRVSSLLHCCNTCAWRADNDPERYGNGWSVHRGQDTTGVPVLLADGWWLLDDEGGRSACPEPEGAA